MPTMSVSSSTPRSVSHSGQLHAVCGALEPAVGGGVLALVEDRFDCAGVQLGLELRARVPATQLPRPRVDEVRLSEKWPPRRGGPGRDDVVVPVIAGQQLVDRAGDRGSRRPPAIRPSASRFCTSTMISARMPTNLKPRWVGRTVTPLISRGKK